MQSPWLQMDDYITLIVIFGCMFYTAYRALRYLYFLFKEKIYYFKDLNKEEGQQLKQTKESEKQAKKEKQEQKFQQKLEDFQNKKHIKEDTQYKGTKGFWRETKK